MDIGECSVIPKGLRKKISTIWESPQIFFTEANEVRSVFVCFHTCWLCEMSFSTVTVVKYYSFMLKTDQVYIFGILLLEKKLLLLSLVTNS